MAEALLDDTQVQSELDIDVRPMTGALGAEIRGLDLNELDDAAFDQLHQLLLQYSVLAVHGQAHMSDEDLHAFGSRWGKLDVHGYSPTVDGFKDMLNIRSGPKGRGSAEGWHSDVSWKEIPPKLSMLLARTVPAVGGDTVYASQYKAYEDLSEPVKELLEKLDADHDGRNFDIDLIRKPVRHPVVLTHPETGRKALYVNEGFTRRIAGLSMVESKGLLNMLYDHCTRVRYQARLSYEVGTLSIWDNRCVQHCAPPDYGYEERELHRVAVLCDAKPSR